TFKERGPRSVSRKRKPYGQNLPIAKRTARGGGEAVYLSDSWTVGLRTMERLRVSPPTVHYCSTRGVFDTQFPLTPSVNFSPEETGDSFGATEASSRPDRSGRPWIHLLPHELLLLIFQFYAGMHTPVRNLVRLKLVCKLWQHIVEGTPSLWCWISAKEALPRVRKALAMAKDVPLEIRYPEKGAKTKQENFFAEIRGSITHWRSFVVSTGNTDSVVAVLRSAVAPNIETFHLYGSYRWNRGPVTLFGGEAAPRVLTDFAVHYIPVIMEPLQLSGLRSLDLRELPIISAEEVLRILSVSPALEHCCLQSLECLKDFALPGHKQESLTRHGIKTSTIQLSHLRSLTLEPGIRAPYHSHISSHPGPGGSDKQCPGNRHYLIRRQ
ncbi:hypothetical protein M407DRAFT_235390, partial [Tulasnella calospora MUT 4182]